MSAPMKQPGYFRLCGKWDQRVWKRVESWLPRAGRRYVILLQGVLIALIIGQFTGVSARPTTAGFSVGGNTVARAGQVTYLFCNRGDRKAESPSSYVWVKDGKVIPGHTRQVLTLSSVTRQDTGYYQCGTPDSSSYEQGVYLHVFVPGDVLPQPSIQNIGWPVVGRPYSLHCYFSNYYIPSPDTLYTWYKEVLEVKGQSGDLLGFPNLTEADRGDYTCTAREGDLETTSPPSSEFGVWPLVSPQVRIKPPGPVVKGVRGETLTLTCEVTRANPGVPVDGYSWSYLPSPNNPQRPLEARASTLTLGPLTMEDRGQYVCQARNDQDFSDANVNLSGHASITVDIVYLENLNLTSDLEVSEGDRVTLTCEVDSLPTAQLAWTVRGQEVRHVTDNVDHYVITRAACSDSGSYTCGASNTELPGRDRHATVQLLVHCMQDSLSDTIQSEVGAVFHFPLPDWTPMVVVHPGGHDVISVGQDCSYNVSSAFQSRCLQPWCDSIRHRLSFTLTNVTEEDEGEYVCLEEGPQRKPILNCSKKLHVQKFLTESPHEEHLSTSLTALVTYLLVFFIGTMTGTAFKDKLYFLVQKCSWNDVRRDRMYLYEEIIPPENLVEPLSHNGGEKGRKAKEKKSHVFERLYENGKVYIFPSLIPPQGGITLVSEEGAADESTPLCPHPQLKISAVREEFEIKNLIRLILENSISVRAEELPSFILHNTRLSKQRNVILVLDKRLGIIVMIVNAITDLQSLRSVKTATRDLVEARATIRRKLRGLVTSGTVHAVLSLPCLTSDKADALRQTLQILRSNPGMELLAGQDPRDFRQWAERLRTERGGEFWKSSSQHGHSTDSVYRMVSSRFLALEGLAWPKETTNVALPAESLLLTPAQVEVRDSTATHLHIWGPPGSGKTMLLVHRARQWLAEGKAVVLAVGDEFRDIPLVDVGKAVGKGLNKETCSRIRVCRTLYEIGKAGKDLRSKFHNADICVVIDILTDTSQLYQLLPLVRFRKVSIVWSTGWENLHSGSIGISRKALELGWETIHLPDCIRCTDNTVKLLNKLRHGEFPPIPSCSIPRDQGIPAFRVVDHCLHPDHINTMSSCSLCKEEMSAAFPSMKPSPEWNDWIALHTGDLSISINCESVKEAAVFCGMPVSYDSDTHLCNETVLASSDSRQITSTSDFACFREQVINGVDKKGQPTVHLLRVEDFKGMEREGVILVHWDKRDNDTGRQSQGERATRLEEHRHQWIQAASRSTGQVLLLLLSPSPARSLLGLPEPVMP